MVRDEAVRPRDLPQAPLDEAAAGIPPEDDPGRAEALLRGRTGRKLGAQRRPELIRVEVQNGEVAQVPRRQHAPVAPPAGNGKLPQLSEPIRLPRDVAEPVGDARRVVLARVVAESGRTEDVVRPRRAAVDREGRGAVGERLLPGRVGDRLDRPVEIRPEFVPRMVVHARVGEAVARRLVSAPDDLRDELAMLRDAHAE